MFNKDDERDRFIVAVESMHALSSRILRLNGVEAPRHDENNAYHTDLELAEMAKLLCVGQRSRGNIFGPKSLFHDPAWNIMLHLFSHKFLGGTCLVEDEAKLEDLSVDTISRYLSLLLAHGLIIQSTSAEGKEGLAIAISETGLALMREVLSEYARTFSRSVVVSP